MQYKQLGQSDLSVSRYCLGSMTWGQQTSESDGWRQIDAALDAGINFIDTAELYPTYPITANTQGDTERIIGKWLNTSKRRCDVVLATKVAGAGFSHIRGGTAISRAAIEEAVHNSLAALQTDYIDLYQLHWPNRGHYAFRMNWHYDPTSQDVTMFDEHIDEVLDALDVLVKAGKIRHVGLSNETAWGTAKWLFRAKETQKPRMISIQNEYSLMCRLYDLDCAELSHNEQVDLLAYSPLAMGLLSGKYSKDARPAGSRRIASDSLDGRINARATAAVDAYLAIAKNHDIDPVHMALSWVAMRPFTGSVIFGATTQEQIEHILQGVDIKLSEAVLEDIAVAHKAHPMPF